MSLANWLQSFRSSPAPRRRDRKPTRRDSLRAATHPLHLEPLEDRRLLAFSAPVDYSAGAFPQAIVSADFNNDTIADLAVANYYDSTVSVLLGKGDGTFQPALNSTTGAFPLSVAVGDLDGDGNMDLATANVYDVSVLRGNGDGTFNPPTSHSVAYNPSSVAVGDFTGDGKLDLGVTSNYSFYYYGYYYGAESFANVLVGDGAGNFSGPNWSSLGYGYFASATAANLDGSGADEFLTANSQYGYYYGAVAILESDGAGSLRFSDLLFTGVDALSIAVGDVNGDSVSDIVTADGSYGSVSVLLADGLGGFGTATSYAAGIIPSSALVGDFTGDGNPDIAAVDYYSAGVSLLYGDGNGAFSTAVPFSAGASPWTAAKGDFNRDGWLDVATANTGANTVSVLLNDQNWPPPPPSLSIDDVMVTEGDSGTIAAVFTVTRSGNLDGVATVSYSTADGGALAGSDYVASFGSLTFGSSVATMTITILVNGDVTDEFDQGFYVNLSAPSGAVITDSQGFGNILDNDPEPTITITPKVSAKEGNNNHTTSFVVVVTLSASSEKYVQVNYATANGTATTADSDYIAKSGTLTFAPGVTSQTISVQVKGDKRKESNESFLINLSGALNATIAASQGTGEILDDDTSPGKRKS